MVATAAYAAGVTSRHSVAILSHGGGTAPGPAAHGPGSGRQGRPQLADIGRLARRVMQRTVAAARAEEESVSRLLADHLGTGDATPPIAMGSWPAYDQVNVQTGLETWLAEPGRAHQLVGLTRFRHRDFSLADLLQDRSQPWNPGVGSVATEAIPAGPDGATRACVQCGIYLVTDDDGVAALLIRGHVIAFGDEVLVSTCVAASCSAAYRAPARRTRSGTCSDGCLRAPSCCCPAERSA